MESHGERFGTGFLGSQEGGRKVFFFEKKKQKTFVGSGTH
jgi:hypothetical protein